ncbi:MAG: hypothetical protein IPK80_26325 [Nannocystis sp.]|nr:hypothetical protein [Nannocystis sp.]
MELLDARRLTGPNLQLRGAGALVELRFASPEEADRALPLLDLEHEALTRALGLPPADLRRRRFIDREGREGAALATPAPLDALYTALDALELAVQRVRAGLRGDDPGPLSAALPPLLAARQREARPALLALVAAAEARGLPVLVDDELCTLGHGARSITWPLGQLPAPDQIPWSQLGAIPIALITGTNGKTTCSRLLARVVRCAGLRPGNTTTDGISVDERVIEPGDWTGPAAARLVLRRPDVDIAVLETARGGILRRGLAPHRCDAALITNISADHLGDYGVVDIDGMAQVKAVVTTVVAPTGRVVLGADSPPLCRLPRAFPAPLVWFSLSPDQPTPAAHHRRAAGEAWYVAEGQLVHAVGDHESPLIAVADVPSPSAAPPATTSKTPSPSPPSPTPSTSRALPSSKPYAASPPAPATTLAASTSTSAAAPASSSTSPTTLTASPPWEKSSTTSACATLAAVCSSASASLEIAATTTSAPRPPPCSPSPLITSSSASYRTTYAAAPLEKSAITWSEPSPS